MLQRGLDEFSVATTMTALEYLTTGGLYRSEKAEGVVHWLLGLHEMRPHVSYRAFWKPDGFQESGFLHLDSHFEFQNGREVHTALNYTREGLRTPFEIFPSVVVPPGTYDHREVQLVAKTNQGAPVSFDGTFVFGGFFGGHRVNLRPAMRQPNRVVG